MMIAVHIVCMLASGTHKSFDEYYHLLIVVFCSLFISGYINYLTDKKYR